MIRKRWNRFSGNWCILWLSHCFFRGRNRDGRMDGKKIKIGVVATGLPIATETANRVKALAAELYRGDPPVIDFHPQCFRRSEEHTSELQSLMRISYAVFCLKKKTKQKSKTKHR